MGVLWNISNYSLIQSFVVSKSGILGNWNIKHFLYKGYILRYLVKETCSIDEFWAHAASQEGFQISAVLPRGAVMPFSGRWAKHLHGLCLCMDWLLSPQCLKVLACPKIRFWFPFLLLFDTLLYCPKSTEREFSVNIRIWKPAQVLSRHLKEARAHCVNIGTSPILG